MSRSFSLFINFDGNCREALEFYAKVFQSEVQGLMSYGQLPTGDGYIVADEDREHILYCSVHIFGCNVMFCDVPSNMPLTRGDNISPTLGTDDKEEIRRIFAELSQGGEVLMALDKTFWSELYGMVQDKYGIIWQLSHDNGGMA
ncbi:VOC family protein [Treponema sp. OttesenSCG-928-L16]|nr:VOC family protein [Treponema sp. OttesenSCG-928-L16]